MGCNGDKVLGLDGLPTSFLQHSWEVIRDDILLFFAFFHDTGNIVVLLNWTFVVLIPAVKDATDIEDFTLLVL